MTKFHISSHAVIRKEDKILTTLRSKNDTYKPLHWDFPGGKIEPGEKAEEGLRREIQEETGLEIKVNNLEYIYTNLEGFPESQYFMLIYDCEYIGGNIVLNPEEHDEYRWFTIDELNDKNNIIHFAKGWLEYKNSSKS